MPDQEQPGASEGGRLVNLSELAVELGVSRQWLHALRVKDPAFPASRRRPGSTREVWDLAEARVYYDGREKKPGERTDLKPKE